MMDELLWLLARMHTDIGAEGAGVVVARRVLFNCGRLPRVPFPACRNETIASMSYCVLC